LKVHHHEPQPSPKRLGFFIALNRDMIHGTPVRVAMSTLLLIALAVLLQLPSPAPTKTSEAKKQHTTGETRQRENPPPSDWITWLTFVIAGAAVVQVIVYIFQTHYIRRSLHATATTMILTQRPKLEVRHVVMEEAAQLLNAAGAGSLPDIITGSYEIVNVGTSTAEILSKEERVFLWIDPPPKIPFAPESEKRIAPIHLRPGVYYTEEFKEDFGVTIIAFQMVPMMRVFFVGWICYKDQLGNMRTTRFCRIFDTRTRRFVKFGDEEHEHVD
jgi:hypothetical protein